MGVGPLECQHGYERTEKTDKGLQQNDNNTRTLKERAHGHNGSCGSTHRQHDSCDGIVKEVFGIGNTIANNQEEPGDAEQIEQYHPNTDGSLGTPDRRFHLVILLLGGIAGHLIAVEINMLCIEQPQCLYPLHKFALIAIRLREVGIRILMIEHGKPLGKDSLVQFRSYLRPIFAGYLKPVLQQVTTWHDILRNGTQNATGSVSSSIEVIRTVAVAVLIALQVETAVNQRQLLRPSMQLCIIMETSLRIGEIFNLTGKLLLADVLTTLHDIAQQITDFLWRVCFAQIVGSPLVKVIEYLIGQGL